MEYLYAQTGRVLQNNEEEGGDERTAEKVPDEVDEDKGFQVSLLPL